MWCSVQTQTTTHASQNREAVSLPKDPLLLLLLLLHPSSAPPRRRQTEGGCFEKSSASNTTPWQQNTRCPRSETLSRNEKITFMFQAQTQQNRLNKKKICRGIKQKKQLKQFRAIASTIRTSLRDGHRTATGWLIEPNRSWSRRTVSHDNDDDDDDLLIAPTPP